MLYNLASTSMNPFQQFSEWYKQEIEQSKRMVPNSCCLSTIGLDNYPNARFVAFKEMKNETFIFCGPLDSQKGIEINTNSKVALTFWWDTTQKQIRIQGDAVQISEAESDCYFKERNRDSQIVSLVSKQGRQIDNIEILNQKYNKTAIRLKNEIISRPKNWGGYSVNPLRIEFLEFNKNRFHKRTLFIKHDGQWKMVFLQP
jgi:pyridoxamine 5'-phosphate oxidase